MINAVKRLLSISYSETSCERRGFRHADSAVRNRLEEIGCAFVDGYHAALDESDHGALAARLNTTELESRGFAFEGAAMGLMVLDALTPWRRRLRGFVEGAGTAHIYMTHVGAGWAIARIPWLRRRGSRAISGLDPLLGWLAFDGYGFHEGYFGWRRYVEGGHPQPRALDGYAARAFDQGLGRSLWFVDGADVARIPSTIARLSEARHADLWSGVGLASAYAGGVERYGLEALRDVAASYRSHLAQGAAFAAKARERAGNPALHTEIACEALCDASAEEAARITDIARRNLPADGTEPAYEIWRRRIQTHFCERKTL